MTPRTLPLVTLMLALAGCNLFDRDLEDYYLDGYAPSVDSIEPGSAAGNIGGTEVVISGSGFGSSVDEVVVLFDNHNADILSVSDSEIVARAPVGPLTGGAVDVQVATPGGYGQLDAGFVYDMGTIYDGQVGYVVVENAFETCYGGVGFPGCENVVFTGQTGIDGTAEVLSFAYPRLNATRWGWLTGNDTSPDGWWITSPDRAAPQGVDQRVEDLRRAVGPITLRNPLFEGQEFCVDPSANLAQGPHPCSDDTITYDRGVLEFCEGEDAIAGGTLLYEADWPVRHNFFQGEDGPYAPVEVLLDAPAIGLNGAKLQLPGATQFLAESGWQNNDQWFVSDFARCLDGDGDGEARLDEAGAVLSWEPISVDLELVEGTAAEAVNSYVHVSATRVNLGWYGLELSGIRASTVVSDDNLYDEGSGRSYVEIPNAVLYQFPGANPEWSSYNDLTGVGKLGTFASDASYMFVEAYRVTDYRVATDRGPIIFSYVTGELSFSTFNNPLDQAGDCRDCLDDDGDGWVDALDPDCNEGVGGNGETESSATSAFTCNDGLDNDGNGLTDSDDPLCDNGWDGETTCGDGIDNDLDGWIDTLDADCPPGDAFAQEDGGVVTVCSDGLDNDGDSWVDALDPGCTDGRGDSEGGFLGTPCNDGIDNDGHGDADALDPYCVQIGGGASSEEPTWISRCADALDNDSDGFFNGFDPDCEYAPYSRESFQFHDPAEYPLTGECYDGLDNDGDGFADADDPSCWNPVLDFMADGFLRDESATYGTGCTDGADEDGDGWIDAADPDCAAGSADTQDEVGVGTTVCNDGIDNDCDGLFDAADSTYCTSASGSFEGPSGC